MTTDKARLRGRADYLALKDAHAEALDIIGGAKAAAEETRVDPSRLSRYGSPHEVVYAPTDVALDLDTLALAETGDAPFLRTLAELLGFDLVRRGAEPVPASSYATHLGEIGQESGELIAAMAEAVADGTVTPAEAARIDRKTIDVQQAARRVRRKNQAVRSGEG